MSHPYDRNGSCECKRCTRERARRAGQSAQTQAVIGIHKALERSQRSQRTRERVASRAEQHALYLDTGPQAWDDRGESHD